MLGDSFSNEVRAEAPSSPTIGPSPPGLSVQSTKNTVLKSHGRPPWYGENGIPLSDAFVVGIAGGSASGKTHVARQIVRALGSIPTVIILSQDSFYKRLSPEQQELAFSSRFDFDHPNALDMPMFASCLSDLKACKQTNIPIYSFAKHQRLDETKYLYGAAIIITEGIMALQDPTLRELYDLKIFVQCDSDLMLARRIRRDVAERGRNVEGVLEQYLRYVKPAFDNFVEPTSRHADIIVPGSDNSRAIGLITDHIRHQLDERCRPLRQRMATPHLDTALRLSTPESRLEQLKLNILPQTPQVKGIYTVLRDKTTSHEDFIFFTDRLATILAENAVQLLPHRLKSVVTPVDVEYKGKELDAPFICGVPILRSGGPLERGLQRVLNDVLMGSLLVQTDAKSGEPLLLHVMLPACVRERKSAQNTWVFLLDAQIGTAAAAFMAIRVLLDHGVRQDHIIFVTFLIARSGGISVLRQAFPDVKIVCGAVDDNVREAFHEPEHPGEDRKKCWIVEPGMGQIGDRYYL
ncbi:hypothetical protein PLICRDRAFT_40168 [Plicaturopsis crispa FD-325 SS-3]|nr:hypothetical protein PLICRDRAFT_40168 [Plicaturopsis crispa FD-325 SS-3]